MTRLKNLRFDPDTDNEKDLMRQNGAHRKAMEDALLKGQVEKAAEAWDKSDRLVERLEEVRARKGQSANRRGKNGPLHGQDTEIGHLTEGEIVVPLNAQTPQVMRALKNSMGDTLGRYTVGSGREARNQESGLPAYYGSPAQQSQSRGGFQGWVDQIIGQQLPRFGTPPPGYNQPIPLPGQPSNPGPISGGGSRNPWTPQEPYVPGMPSMPTMSGHLTNPLTGQSSYNQGGFATPAMSAPPSELEEIDAKIDEYWEEIEEIRDRIQRVRAEMRSDLLRNWSDDDLKGTINELNDWAETLAGIAVSLAAINVITHGQVEAVKDARNACAAIAATAKGLANELDQELDSRKA